MVVDMAFNTSVFAANQSARHPALSKPAHARTGALTR
jgi:hypothetical protein